MKLSIKLLMMIVLITILLTACGSNLESPPLVYLVVGDAKTQLKNVAGFKTSNPIQLTIKGEKYK